MSQTSLRCSRRAFLGGAAAALAAPAIGRASSVAPGHGLSFQVLGDWGERGADGQRQVSAAMTRAAHRTAPDFVISVGDDFYGNGVTSTRDPQWEETFEAVYNDPALKCPWYPVLGNHDRRGNPEAEIDFTAVDPRWQMAGRFYRVTKVLPDGGLADFIFLDTTPIVEDWWDYVLDQVQLGWLERELADSRARWKIVVGHHPVFSGGQHGDNTEMLEHVKPLLDRHGVAAYICGHDHDLEDILVDGIHYLVCGAGAQTRPAHRIDGTEFVASRLEFLTTTVTPTVLRAAFIGTDGAVMHGLEIPSPES